MSQDKDDNAKPPVTGPSGPSGPVVDPAKRPYATIDMKAVEVERAAKPSRPEMGKPGAKPETKTAPAPEPQPVSGAAQKAGSQPPVAGPARIPSPWIPSLISGAAGALLTLLGLGSMGLIGGDPNAGTMAERLAALEKSTASQSTADVRKQVVAAEARLAAVETAAQDIAAQTSTLAADTKALDGRVASQAPIATSAAERVQKLETQLADLAASAGDPQRGRVIPDLARIMTKLGDLDTQITTRTAALKAELSQDIDKRTTLLAETDEAARARLAQRTQSIEQTVKSLAEDTTALRGSVDGLKGDLEARFKATAKPADLAAAIEPVATTVAGLQKNLAGVVRSEQDRNATAGNILLSIELGNLKRALDRGGKYAAELAAVKKVGGDKLNLAVLEQAQTVGVPSIAALAAEFRSLAYAMLDAEAEPSDGSVFDRMLAGAKSVVRVRKIAHGADDKGTEATISRMETALKDNRLGDVLEEGKKLGDKPLAVAAPWLKKIEARYAIENALADLDQSLKNALAGSATAQKGGN